MLRGGRTLIQKDGGNLHSGHSNLGAANFSHFIHSTDSLLLVSAAQNNRETMLPIPLSSVMKELCKCPAGEDRNSLLNAGNSFRVTPNHSSYPRFCFVVVNKKRKEFVNEWKRYAKRDTTSGQITQESLDKTERMAQVGGSGHYYESAARNAEWRQEDSILLWAYYYPSSLSLRIDRKELERRASNGCAHAPIDELQSLRLDCFLLCVAAVAISPCSRRQSRRRTRLHDGVGKKTDQ